MFEWFSILHMMNFENNNDVDELTNRLNESKEAKLRFNKFEKAFQNQNSRPQTAGGKSVMASRMGSSMM